MKSEKLTLPIVAMLLMGAVACSKSGEDTGGDPTTGRLTVSLAAEQQVADVTRSQVSDFAQTMPDRNDFTLTVKRRGETAVVWTGKHAEVPAAGIELAAGDYTAEASYGSAADEGFDKARFSTEQPVQFTVNGGQSTSVALTAKPANTIIKMETTERFRNYFPKHGFTLTTGAGTAIEFPKGETRGAFIEATKFKVAGTLTNQGGTQQSFAKEYTAVNPATCYTITFDASGTDGARIEITFDNDVQTVDLGDIDLNE